MKKEEAAQRNEEEVAEPPEEIPTQPREEEAAQQNEEEVAEPPEEIRTQSHEEVPVQSVNVVEMYLYQVEAKLRNEPKLYKDFMILMKHYESGEIDQLGVLRRIGHMFQDHPELIVGFNQVLAPGYNIQVTTNDQGNAVRIFLGMSISPATITTEENVEMLVDSTSSSNEVVVSQSSDLVSRTQARIFGNALSYLNEVKNKFKDQPWVYHDFLSLMKKCKNRALDTREFMHKIRRLFHEHDELFVGVNQFLPPGYKFETHDDD
ncbi:paired amphipathic helix protein Sin3b-like [Trichogramma pretiosum]|uniref:paired amphipathic helix protein Sin3b-like n=1 Tax=Trichogramma pretiosum TaxID=7493 RepID=UPI0006C9699E|nr:paired amphipathic helix protein Sin3b-like [Trichogramma pretiosum]